MMNGIESFANMILKEACRVQASDLHITVPRQKDVVVQLRIGKDLMTKQYIEKEFGEKLVSHFKFLASMDIGERAETTKRFIIYTNRWTRSVFTPFHASNRISRKSRYSSSFTSVYSAVISSFVISKYSEETTFFLHYSHGLPGLYGTDWFRKDKQQCMHY